MIRQVTLEDLVAFPFAGVSDASLSCDGRTVLYVVNGTIRRLDAENGLESEVGAGFRPRHSPVDPARWSCQCRSREGICVRVEGADDRWIGADIRGIRRTVWSPDGQSIAILADAVPQAAAGAAASGVPTVRRLGDSHRGERSRLAVLDSESGECRLNLESEPGVSFAEMTWHPASRLLTVLAWVHEPGWGLRWQLLDVELAGGGARCRLGPASREIECPCWSPDGTRLAFAYCPYDSMNMVRDACAVMPAEGGEVTILNEDYYVTDLAWAPDGRFLIGTGIAGLTRHVFRVDAATGRAERLTAQPGRHRLRGVSADGRWTLLLYQSPNGLQEAERLDLRTSEIQPLTRVGAAMAETLALSPAELVEWTSPDGLRLEGVWVRALDEGTAENATPPTIVDLHGGPAGGGEIVFKPEWQWLAAQGFNVFAPGYRGSQQFGRHGPLAEDGDLKDILSGVAALADRGLCQPGRIGLHGFSHGAHLGAWILGHSDVFSAAVLVGGCYDWRLAYGAGSDTFGNAILAMDFGGMPWEAPETYARLSAVTHAGCVTAAVLLLQGGEDNRAQAEIYGTWLRGAGKTVEVVIYEGDGHPPRKPEHVRDRWSRTGEWFRKALAAKAGGIPSRGGQRA